MVGKIPLEKEMAAHSSILAWRIPWMEEPGGLQSMGSQRVRHDWATSLSFTFTLARSVPLLSHSIVFLYFFALISEEGFLISPCCSLELCIQTVYLYFSPFPFTSFHSYLLRPPQTTILPFCISFSWEWSWSLPPIQCHKPLSIVLQVLCQSDLIPWIYFSLPLYNCKRFELGHTWMI